MLIHKEIIAIERGKRLRICRGYTGLNITDFCEKHHFNTITFGRWERGNKVSLNEKNVEKVCHALLNEGVACSRAWLLHGEGQAPSGLKTSYPLFQGEHEKNTDVLPIFLIFSEISTFERNNPNSITHMINNTDMAPLYEEGDYVGGIQLDRSDYYLANKKTAIIKYSGSSKLIVRSIQFSAHKIILTATNPKSSFSEPVILEEDSLAIIAPIILHRKDPAWVWKKV